MIPIIPIVLIYGMYSNTPLEIKDIIVVYPSFTQAAYQSHGFYDYYNHGCDISCLTVHFNQSDPNQMSSSRNAFKMFKAYGFKLIDDSYLDSNPLILSHYKKVVLLHNEYVTQTEFESITNHPNVLYLYPNSLYGLVQNNQNRTITLLNGHSYKQEGNGFEWKYDNTRFEFDRSCNNMEFYHIPNGTQINCYPEYSLNNGKIWNEVLHQ